jgi:hypothetical protein
MQHSSLSYSDLPSHLCVKLDQFNQRPLHKGELFLLAKAIADALPLMSAGEESATLFVITHKYFINNIIHKITMYTYLSDEDIKSIFDIVEGLTLWRSVVAHTPPTPMFKNEKNNVIDDLSYLPRYIDVTYMCAVEDILSKANYTYSLFKEIVIHTKTNMKA